MLPTHGVASVAALLHSDLASCPRCGQESLHDLERRYRVALLWLPIFRFGEHIVGQCGHCLAEYPVVSLGALKAPSVPLVVALLDAKHRVLGEHDVPRDMLCRLVPAACGGAAPRPRVAARGRGGVR